MTREEKKKELESFGIAFKKRNRGEGRYPVWEAHFDGRVITEPFKMIADCIDNVCSQLGG